MTDITNQEGKSAPPHRHDIVTITYNGGDDEVPFNPNAGMESLLNHALDGFNIHENRHLMALWTTSGVELPVTGSVAEAGIKAGDLLVLRPSAVRGGSLC